MSEGQWPAITLYGAKACHLCSEAKALAVPILGEYGLELDYVLIDGIEALEAAYRADIPVLLIDDVRVAKHRVDGRALRRALDSRVLKRRP